MKITFIKNSLIVICCLISSFVLSQNEDHVKYTATNKGKFFISWGGNRASYSKSKIRFKGNNYDFSIDKATAKDKPKGWHIDYINPKRITIPQTNFKLGYFISEHYSISIGLDHMKYVMEQNKTRTLNGHIDLPTSEPGSIYNGTYFNETFFVSEDFLEFEHTDGLNYIYLEIGRQDDISTLLNLPNIDKFQINISTGLAAGILYPKTNATVIGNQRYDEFHVSGYGTSIKAGINFTFFKHFYMQADLKGGYINMNDIKTSSDGSGRAFQHFFFLERVISFGGIFRL